jgi:hypothetical protein
VPDSDFKPTSKLVTERPDLFSHLSPERLKKADEAVGEMIHEVLWPGSFADLFDKLQDRSGDERHFPKFEFTHFIGSGTFALVLGGRINGIPTEDGDENHAVIRLVKRGSPIADAETLNHSLVLPHAHREIFRPDRDDPAGWWVSVVPHVDFSDVRESDVFRTARLYAQQGLASHFGDFSLGQFANLVRPNGIPYEFPEVEIEGKTFPPRKIVVLADRNSVVASTAGVEDFLKGTKALEDGLDDLAQRMYMDLNKVAPLPEPVLAQLLDAASRIQVEQLTTLTNRFDLSQEHVLELAQLFNSDADFLVVLAQKHPVSAEFLTGLMNRFPLTKEQVGLLKERFEDRLPPPPTQQDEASVIPIRPPERDQDQSPQREL